MRGEEDLWKEKKDLGRRRFGEVHQQLPESRKKDMDTDVAYQN